MYTSSKFEYLHPNLVTHSSPLYVLTPTDKQCIILLLSYMTTAFCLSQYHSLNIIAANIRKRTEKITIKIHFSEVCVFIFKEYNFLNGETNGTRTRTHSVEASHATPFTS